MRYVLTSIDTGSPRTSPAWTGYLDIPSKLERPMSTMSLTLPPRSRDKEKEPKPGAKFSNKGGSFLKFISLVQILVFVYHVILSAKRGLTIGLNGPADVLLEVSVKFELVMLSFF